MSNQQKSRFINGFLLCKSGFSLFLGRDEQVERIDASVVFPYLEVNVRTVRAFAALRRRHLAEELSLLYACSRFQGAGLLERQIFGGVSVFVTYHDVIAVEIVVAYFFNNTVRRTEYVEVFRRKVKRAVSGVLFESRTPYELCVAVILADRAVVAGHKEFERFVYGLLVVVRRFGVVGIDDGRVLRRRYRRVGVRQIVVASNRQSDDRRNGRYAQYDKEIECVAFHKTAKAFHCN